MTAKTFERPRIAFYAPMKSPDHPTPSGDRRIARLTLQALALAGFNPVKVSDFRSLDMKGDASVQRDVQQQTQAERKAVEARLADTRPALWFTYHCYYKAPDLLGSELARDLGIPYVISEPSISPRRRDGPWSAFASASETAIARADHLFWTTARDRSALIKAGYSAKMTYLPAFIETSESMPAREAPHAPLRLLTIAMMRAGDKVESFRRLAAALAHLEPDWHLTIIGDGSERPKVEALFGRFADRVSFCGQVDCQSRMALALEQADLFVWPGVNEGVGMVYLEAQAAGLPVIAEDHPAPSELVAGACTHPNDPRAFANRISHLSQPEQYRAASQAALVHIAERHSLSAAAETLKQSLHKLLQ